MSYTRVQQKRVLLEKYFEGEEGAEDSIVWRNYRYPVQCESKILNRGSMRTILERGEIKCVVCGEQGHDKRNCPTRRCAMCEIVCDLNDDGVCADCTVNGGEFSE